MKTENLIDTTAAATLCNVSKHTISSAARYGHIRGQKTGRVWLVNRDDCVRRYPHGNIICRPGGYKHENAAHADAAAQVADTTAPPPCATPPADDFITRGLSLHSTLANALQTATGEKARFFTNTTKHVGCSVHSENYTLTITRK